MTLNILIIASFIAFASAACLPVTPVKGLNLTEWTRATWYIQEQQLTQYQQANVLFCVTATYQLDDKSKVPFFSGEVRSVYNYQNTDEVNGIPGGFINSTAPQLCARVPDANYPSKLLVAPCFLPNLFAGDYWVIAVGTDANGLYTWGVVSGGQPTVQYPDGCTTSTTSTNGAGLWIFNRSPVANQDDMAQAHFALKSMGYTLSQLLPVPQAGCLYTDDMIHN